jgi:hypothetical protein
VGFSYLGNQNKLPSQIPNKYNVKNQIDKKKLGGQKNIKDMDISPDCANQPLVLAKKGLNIHISFKFGP